MVLPTYSLELLLYTVGIYSVAALQVFGQFLCGRVESNLLI